MSAGVCRLCGWRRDFRSEEQARRASVWHTYDRHRETWLVIVGDRPPADPRPFP